MAANTSPSLSRSRSYTATYLTPSSVHCVHPTVASTVLRMAETILFSSFSVGMITETVGLTSSSREHPVAASNSGRSSGVSTSESVASNTRQSTVAAEALATWDKVVFQASLFKNPLRINCYCHFRKAFNKTWEKIESLPCCCKTAEVPHLMAMGAPGQKILASRSLDISEPLATPTR